MRSIAAFAQAHHVIHGAEPGIEDGLGPFPVTLAGIGHQADLIADAPSDLAAQRAQAIESIKLGSAQGNEIRPSIRG
jgi:hypothetical protein